MLTCRSSSSYLAIPHWPEASETNESLVHHFGIRASKVPELLENYSKILSARSTQKLSFGDCFLDTSDYKLALNGMWLRIRENIVSENATYSLKKVTIEGKYLLVQEKNDLDDIISILQSILGPTINSVVKTENLFLLWPSLLVQAAIYTSRLQFSLNENFKFTIDFADVGGRSIAVGSVRYQGNFEKIIDFKELLGESYIEKVNSKVIEAFLHCNRSAYDILLENRIIVEITSNEHILEKFPNGYEYPE
jgi:hypothetical protein